MKAVTMISTYYPKLDLELSMLWPKFIYLLDFPKDGPKISTIPLGRNEYRVGDTAHLMCKAQKSSPPTELSWYINGEPVSIGTLPFCIK